MFDICLLGTGGMMPLPGRWLTSCLIRYNGTTVLIDCGEGTQVAIREKGWSFKPIDVICFTHFHADHIGGNQYLQKQTGCKIYAPGIECDFTNHPILEPSFLYGGYPFKDLKNKFLMAKESDAVEAEGKAKANSIVSASITDKILRDKGIEATLKLAESPNSKVVIIGGNDGMPIILGDVK